MKKALPILGLIIIFTLVCLADFDFSVKAEPKVYYQVYLDGEVVGVIQSKQALETYINERNADYQKQFGVDTIYSPNGLDVQKILTYGGKIDSVEEIYDKIVDRKPFTINGYQFTITTKINEEKENSETETKTKVVKIYTTQEDIFKQATVNLMKTFTGEDAYDAYINHTQSAIVTTGTYINKIYLADDITIKNVKIPVSEKIYNNAIDLTKFLLFGNNQEQKKYTVKVGDTIEEVSLNNKISTQEFLISNPSFTSTASLLFPGQEVMIGITDPQLQVVVETSVVEDKVKKYPTVVKYDANLQQGYNKVTQEGVNGLERVSQQIKTINGNIAYIKPEGNVELKTAIPEIVIYGQKVIPSVGITGNWLWPTRSGWSLSSSYGWRISPFSTSREFHTGLDIAGTGYGSPVYAANNGTVITSSYHYSYGNYIVINHNNGYYTLYAHMSKRLKSVGDIVARGDTIGKVGQTGSASGPHLHFEVWRGGAPFSGTRLNPATLKYFY